MDSRANFSREIQKCKFFSVRIFVFINVCLIVSTIRNCKVICTAVTWLAVYGILLFCMIVHGKRNDIKMWIPGISLNRYLIWLVGDPYLLSVLSTGICCTTVWDWRTARRLFLDKRSGPSPMRGTARRPRVRVQACCPRLTLTVKVLLLVTAKQSINNATRERKSVPLIKRR